MMGTYIQLRFTGFELRMDTNIRTVIPFLRQGNKQLPTRFDTCFAEELPAPFLRGSVSFLVLKTNADSKHGSSESAFAIFVLIPNYQSTD